MTNSFCWISSRTSATCRESTPSYLLCPDSWLDSMRFDCPQEAVLTNPPKSFAREEAWVLFLSMPPPHPHPPLLLPIAIRRFKIDFFSQTRDVLNHAGLMKFLRDRARAEAASNVEQLLISEYCCFHSLQHASGQQL